VAGANHYLVMRGAGGGCPVAVSTASARKASRPTLTDATAKPGAAYCYSVYPVDAYGNVQKTGATSNTVTVGAVATGATPVASTGPATSGSAKPSNDAFSSQLSRMVAAVGAATFVFGLIMLIGIRLQGSSGRRRVESFYYPRHRGGLARVALDQYDARALVIPAVLFVGLIVLAAAAALAL
jgi:hypothetical protein